LNRRIYDSLILKNSIEDKNDDESDVIEQKNLRFSNIEKYH
jgi:hypothetical protein